MLTKSKIPSHFSVIKSGNETIFVKRGYSEIVKNIVFNNRFSVNRQATNIDIKSGRGQYLSIPIAKDSTEKIIIRDYKHGGLFGKLFGNVFFNWNRPFNEIYVNEIAFQKNVPTAEAIAVYKRKLWGVFYKASFISKEVTDAVDIIQFLRESPIEFIQKSKRSIISALARLIRNMHDAGIYHADLHLKNILLKKDTKDGFNAYIIDLDKSVFLDSLGVNQRIKNLLRLDRSFEKMRCLLGKADTRNNNSYEFNINHNGLAEKADIGSLKKKINLISRTDKIRFLRSYVLHNNALGNDWKIYIRQHYSHYSTHRFWWFVLGLFRK